MQVRATDTTVHEARRTPGVERLWTAYGRGSAMLFRSAPGGLVDLRPRGSLTMSGEPCIEMNWGVIGGGDGDADGPETPADHAALLCDFVETILDRGVDAYLMAGSATAPALEPVAARLGLPVGPGSPLMVRRCTAKRVFVIEQETVTVERVDDEWALRDVAGVLEAAFETPAGAVERALAPPMLAVPGLDVFVLRLSGEAASAVVTTRVDDLVGVWAMGTAPILRRRHLGRRLLEAVIDFHGERADSPEWFFLGASTMGRPLYESLGFTVVDESRFIDVLVPSGTSI